MNNCKTCKHAIFDSVWGDFKCDVHQIIVHPDQRMDCEKYSKGTPTTSKRDYDNYSQSRD